MLEERSWHAEYIVAGLTGEFGYDVDRFVRGSYQAQQRQTIDRVLDRITKLGYVVESRPVGPRGELRQQITGFSGAQRLAYAAGLVPEGELRDPLLKALEEDPTCTDMLRCAVAFQRDGMLALDAFVAARLVFG